MAWNLPLEGYAEQWMDLVDEFESGRQQKLLPCATLKEAEALRFEWYAFKAKVRKSEADLPYEQRMHPTVSRIRAEIGQMRDGRFALKLMTRDVGRTAQILEGGINADDDDYGFVSCAPKRAAEGDQ